LAAPAKGQVDPASPWFGKPTFDIKYDKAAAKKLVEEGGLFARQPLKTTFVIASAAPGRCFAADERIHPAEF